MGKTGKRLIAGLAVAALSALGSAALAQARSGDVFVADRNAGAILKIPPSGGPATALVSDVEAPYGMTLGRDGSLLVADQSLGIVRVNRTTGAVKPIFTVPGGDVPTDVAVAPDGKLLVTAFLGGKVYRVNPKNGNFTTFFNGGAPVINASSLAVSRTGAVFLSDETSGGVYRIARAGAAPTTVLDGLITPDGLTLPADESRLFIGSFADSILWQVFFSGPPFLAPADQPLAFPPYSTAFLRSGKLLASDASNRRDPRDRSLPGHERRPLLDRVADQRAS